MMCVAMPATTTSTSSSPNDEGSGDVGRGGKNDSSVENNNNGDIIGARSKEDKIGLVIPTPDDLCSSDEVKVFKDEDERDGDASESYQAELQAEKSSLINESEQGKSSSGNDKELLRGGSSSVGVDDLGPAALAAVPGMGFGMGYFMNPYAAYAATNGLANGSHMARSTGSPLSPFLYGDPLSSPPPAHMGTYFDKTSVGLRSPLYPLPHTQYPYSMLGADQLAAWHHQASVYQAGALRSASPYSLPITSASLPSPMSRFSPSTLLNHPGLSPGGGAGHLPHVKSDFDGRKEARQNKKKDTHIKKPLNAFMLYMKEMRPVVQAECTLKESAAINQLLGRRWHGLSREEQAKYYEKARVERQKHMQMYPHWNARDNYRFGVKKKKRKREKSAEPGSSMKKCRARYGLDQHNLWCKPCRRKKKCIRVQAYLDSKAHGGKGNNCGLNGVKSDHDFDDEDDDDVDCEGGINDPTRSKSAGGGQDSVETTSEPSLTSPSGFSSLGSPCSIASPQTPQPYDCNSTSSWYRPSASSTTTLSSGSGAFKPPNSSSSLYAYNRTTTNNVGTDPRDAKHPLSISQLTGKSSSSHQNNILVSEAPGAAVCATAAFLQSSDGERSLLR